MLNGFTKGLIVGSILGASISMMMEPDIMKRRNKKRMIRAGRNFLRRTGNIISDVVDAFR
ncbi:MAG: YtxH domain-containing protein [Firmicutes bacterium]|nr:YtxH domain-containing protein [Bacillota bacterium]